MTLFGRPLQNQQMKRLKEKESQQCRKQGWPAVLLMVYIRAHLPITWQKTNESGFDPATQESSAEAVWHWTPTHPGSRRRSTAVVAAVHHTASHESSAPWVGGGQPSDFGQKLCRLHICRLRGCWLHGSGHAATRIRGSRIGCHVGAHHPGVDTAVNGLQAATGTATETWGRADLELEANT